MTDQDLCKTCVYFIENLPREEYSEEDWKLMERCRCTIDAKPGDELCTHFRKSSCSIIDLGGDS